MKKNKKILAMLLMMVTAFGVMGQSAYANTDNLPASNRVDVVVVGSDPEGITAAVSAARSGASVVLIDKRNKPGGLYTSGMLSMLDLNYSKSGNNDFVNDGFFREFYNDIAEEANIDIPQAEAYFRNVLAQQGVQTIWDVTSVKPIVENNKVTGVQYSKNGMDYSVNAGVTIDAIPDAPVARAAGASYIVGRDDLGMKNEYAAATLVYSVDNVNWDKVMNYLINDNDLYTGANKRVAWGYSQMLKFHPQTSDRIQVRKLNLSRQNDNSVVINALQIFGVDSLSEASKQEAYNLAKAELPHIVEFMRTLPGFENATLKGHADELYIREGVRIVGLQTLTGEDLFLNKNYANKIAYGSYPMDLQSTRRDAAGGNILTGRNLYTLPLGIMIPRDVENLMVVGRSASYDSLAHSSARTVPVGMGLGEAAGVTAQYAVSNNISLKEANSNYTHITNIQNILRSRGVNLDMPLPTYHPEVKHWSYPYIVNLRQQGMLSKERNYENDYAENETAHHAEFGRITDLIKQNSRLIFGDVSHLKKDGPLKPADAVRYVNALLGTNYANIYEVYNSGVIDMDTYNALLPVTTLTNGHVYAIMDGVVAYQRNQQSQYRPSIESVIRNDLH